MRDHGVRMVTWGRRLGALALSAVALAFALGAVEVLVRLTSIDQRLMTPALYFQAADIPVHRIAADPVLHYELAPGTRCNCETDGRRYTVSIDAHGARYPTHPAAKGVGVFRILCAGGSTVYGAAVNDDQTIPAALEQRLNDSAPRGVRYEAWNFGTSAYTLTQAAHLARARLDSLHPDLVLVQLHNQGRRAFLMPPSFNAVDYPWSQILADPDLFEEQFEFRYWPPTGVREPLLRHSAFARAIAAVSPGFQANSHTCLLCDTRDQAEARGLSEEAEARGVPVIYYSIPADQGRLHAQNVFQGLAADRFIELYQPDREPTFYEVHPPPATLDAFAQRLVDDLRARGLLAMT